MHRYLFLVLLLGVVFKIECDDWIEPSSNEIKWVNESSSVLFEWKYTFNNSNRNGCVAIQCGYFNDSNLKILVQKVGHTSQIQRGPDRTSSRIDVVTRSNKSGSVAFKLRSAKASDEYVYRCLLNTPLTKESRKYTLKVLKRPEFQTFTVTPESVQAGKTITINVVTTGNPVPKLICYLMSTSGIEIDRFPRSGRVNNITQKTFLVTKESKEVLCIATGDRTGSVYDTRQLNVISVPFKVKSLEQVESIIDSSITVRWFHIPSNETGDPSQGEKFLLRYELVWWDKTVENLGNETVLNLGLPGTQIQNQFFYKKNNYVYFTLSGLNMKHRYGIVVYGVNSLGNGPETEINTAFRPKHTARCAPTVIEFRSLEDKKTISSPSYPSPYDHNLNCSYYIYGLLDVKIKIDFEMFQIHSDSSLKCNADRIETYKRGKKSIELVETKCGKQYNLTIKHPADFMRLNFITMKGNSGSQGFKANVYMVPDSKKKSSKATLTQRAFILTVLVCYLVTLLV